MNREWIRKEEKIRPIFGRNAEKPPGILDVSDSLKVFLCQAKGGDFYSGKGTDQQRNGWLLFVFLAASDDSTAGAAQKDAWTVTLPDPAADLLAVIGIISGGENDGKIGLVPTHGAFDLCVNRFECGIEIA